MAVEGGLGVERLAHLMDLDLRVEQVQGQVTLAAVPARVDGPHDLLAIAHAGNTAMVAVNPCRKLRPPTGPISPAQKKPAVGAPRESSTAEAS